MCQIWFIDSLTCVVMIVMGRRRRHRIFEEKGPGGSAVLGLVGAWKKGKRWTSYQKELHIELRRQQGHL